MDEKPTEIIAPEFPPLNGKKLLAFELKFDRVNYKEIAEKTGYTENYIHRAFRTTGSWIEHYSWWREQRVNEIEKDGRLRIKQRIEEALTVQETMLTLIKSNPKEAARAARDLLDRAGLKAPEKVEVTSPIDQAEAITKWFEGKNKVVKKEEVKAEE